MIFFFIPRSPGTIFFSFTASIISLDMNITSAGYCVNNFQGGSTPAINDMLGKTLSLAELKSILIAAAVDIFPEPDTFCYTEGTCEKNFVMEMHLYACISTLVQSHNFSWSRWNLLAGSRTIVLLMRELIEGKKVVRMDNVQIHITLNILFDISTYFLSPWLALSFHVTRDSAKDCYNRLH